MREAGVYDATLSAVSDLAGEKVRASIYEAYNGGLKLAAGGNGAHIHQADLPESVWSDQAKGKYVEAAGTRAGRLGRPLGLGPAVRAVAIHPLLVRGELAGAVLAAAETPFSEEFRKGLAALATLTALALLGHRVDVASDGAEALDALDRTEYAAVLMDVQMPGMDGYGATEGIRRRETEHGTRRTPVIAMTANAMRGDREKAIEAGMDDYLTKPVTLEALAAILDRWATPGPESTPWAGRTKGPPLDAKVLEGLRRLDDPGLLEELIPTFFVTSGGRSSELARTIASDDRPGVERTAHALKGAAANIGATGMVEICAMLQQAGASGDLSQAPRLLTRLRSEYGRVRPALEAERNGP